MISPFIFKWKISVTLSTIKIYFKIKWNKSILSDISIATPTFFKFPPAYIFLSLHFQCIYVFQSAWVPYRFHIDGSCFYIHAATQSLLIGAFSLHICKVITDRYAFITTLFIVLGLVFIVFLYSFLLLLASFLVLCWFSLVLGFSPFIFTFISF